MPIEFSTCLDCDLVYARWYGHINFDQFQKNFLRYLGDVNYRPGRPELIDHSGIANFDADFRQVRSILRQVNEQVPKTSVSTHTVIYSPNDTVFGMGRMYQTLAEISDGIKVEVFQTEREALDAAGMPHETISSLLDLEAFVPAKLRTDDLGRKP